MFTLNEGFVMKIFKKIREKLIGKVAYNEHVCKRCGTLSFERLKIAGDEAWEQLRNDEDYKELFEVTKPNEGKKDGNI